MRNLLVQLVVAVIVVGVGIALLKAGKLSLPYRGTNARTERNRSPFEYLYLDSARVDAYLSQLNEGEVKTEERSENTAIKAEGALEVDKLGKATSSASNERKISAVVTRTQADNFYRLLKELRSEGSLTTVDLEAPDAVEKLGAVKDGGMVLLTNVFLRVPPYLSAYPALRYASYSYAKHETVFGPAPLTTFSASEPTLNTEARAQRNAFIKNAGENPRLPLTASPHGLTVLAPARFANITGDVSLFGARLNMMGKVVFKGERFGDGASIATYLPALLRASGGFLHDLGMRASFLRRYEHAIASRDKAAVRHAQACIFKALSRSLSFHRTVEVIPVAIYD